MFLTLEKAPIEGKKVIVRVDFNVPISQGKISNDKKIRESLPTIKYLLDKGCKVILMSHLGQPQKDLKAGKSMEDIKKKNTLSPVADRLSELLNKKVAFMNDCIDIQLPFTGVVLLENLRFHKEEEKDDMEFAKKLASHADFYVNDAFGTCHRAHASVSAITKLLPASAGFLVQKELDNLGKTVGNVAKPFIAIIGGAKEDKIAVIRSLIPKVDKIIIAGVLANTFLREKGMDIGMSKWDGESAKVADELIALAGNKLLLPVDFIVADKFDNDANNKVAKGSVPPGWMILDIGPETINLYKDMLRNAKTIVWAGPIGVFEFDKFSNGTKEIATFITTINATTIIGGGDSAACIEKFGLEKKVTHVSTGGGASLEFIELDGRLPAIVALEENYRIFSGK